MKKSNRNEADRNSVLVEASIRYFYSESYQSTRGSPYMEGGTGLLFKDAWLICVLVQVTDEAIHSTRAFHEQLAVAMRAPAEAKWVPPPKEVGGDSQVLGSL